MQTIVGLEVLTSVTICGIFSYIKYSSRKSLKNICIVLLTDRVNSVRPPRCHNVKKTLKISEHSTWSCENVMLKKILNMLKSSIDTEY